MRAGSPRQQRHGREEQRELKLARRAREVADGAEGEQLERELGSVGDAEGVGEAEVPRVELRVALDAVVVAHAL